MYFPWKSHGESRGKFMVSPRSNPRIQQMRLPKGGILSQSLHSGGQVDPSGVACTVLVKKMWKSMWNTVIPYVVYI